MAAVTQGRFIRFSAPELPESDLIGHMEWAPIYLPAERLNQGDATFKYYYHRCLRTLQLVLPKSPTLRVGILRLLDIYCAGRLTSDSSRPLPRLLSPISIY